MRKNQYVAIFPKIHKIYHNPEGCDGTVYSGAGLLAFQLDASNFECHWEPLLDIQLTYISQNAMLIPSHCQCDGQEKTEFKVLFSAKDLSLMKKGQAPQTTR